MPDPAVKSPAPFEKLRLIAMEDPALIGRLAAVENQADLFAEVISLGRRHGLEITIPELEEVVRANRRSWIERWAFP